MSEEKKDDILDREKELDESELDAVNGGSCGCVMGGSGKGNDSGSHARYQCACAMYGEGTGIDERCEGLGKMLYCVCTAAGGGADHGLERRPH